MNKMSSSSDLANWKLTFFPNKPINLLVLKSRLWTFLKSTLLVYLTILILLIWLNFLVLFNYLLELSYSLKIRTSIAVRDNHGFRNIAIITSSLAILLYLLFGIKYLNPNVTSYIYNSNRLDISLITNKNIINEVGFSSYNLYSLSRATNQPNSSDNNITTAPIINGPKQSDPRFATYPTWSQNFSDYGFNNLNPKYWNVYSGIPPNSNNESEYYVNNSANLNLANQALNITALNQSEPDNYQYSSARIDTKNKQSFLYGRIDVLAKVPTGVGVWPAVWLLPANNYYRNLSPASDNLRYLNGGEIDLIEEVGFDPNLEYGIVHSLADLSNPYGVGDFNSVYVSKGNAQYNLYSLLWTPSSITFEVNNKPFYTYIKPKDANYTTWPFNQPFYLIANLAIGGIWGGEDKSIYPSGINNQALPATLSIKSIYYYPYLNRN